MESRFVDDVAQPGVGPGGFGMAYRLIDDVLDLIGDPERLGKPVGTDIRNGVLTMPALLELAERHGGGLRALLLRRQLPDLEQASRMFIDSGRIDEVIEVARQYAGDAAATIGDIPGARTLSKFPSSYVDWALEQFVAA